MGELFTGMTASPSPQSPNPPFPRSTIPPIPPLLHLVISLAPGGLERLVVDWTNARNRMAPGSTRLCCLDVMGELASQVKGNAVSCVDARRHRWPYDRAAVKGIRQVLRDGERAPSSLRLSTQHPSPPATLPPVILHAHNLAAWQYAVLVRLTSRSGPSAAVPRPLRLIYTQHGANVHNLSLRDRLRARILACFTDEIIAVSEATADAMSRSLWIPRQRIKVVVNGVAGGGEESEVRSQEQGARRQRCEIRARFAIPEDAFVIGSVGRLAHIKGHDRLINAFAALHPQLSLTTTSLHPSPHLLLIGDGPERLALERQVELLGLAGRVTFSGFQADPVAFYQAMDLFVLPSRSEGLSISLLEAMSHGTPVAVTDVGANREVIDNGRCGLLLPDQEHAWPALLAQAMANPDRDAMTRTARQRVAEKYSLQATLSGYESLYSP